jgi:hypothetical protein
MRSRPRARTGLPSLNATAHVLRHLRDVPALSENALVREVWDARASEHVTLDEVAADVSTVAIAALGAGAAWPSAEKRLREVVLRCDVEAQPHARVMAELAISRAELYRRLAAGRRFVAQRIRERFAESKRGADPFERPLDIRMQGALALVMAGRADEAVRHLAPLLESAAGPDLVVVACALAEIRLDAKLPVEARAYLRLAADEAERLRGTNRTVALAKIASIDTLAETKAGRGTRQTEHELDRHIAALRPLPEPDRLVCDTLSALVLLKAALAAYRGDAAEGLRVLRTSPAADPVRPVSPRPRAEYLTMLVAIRLLLPGELAAAREDDRHLYAFATAHGLQHAVTAALAHRATIEGIGGNFALAARYATEALAASSAFMPRFEHAGVRGSRQLSRALGRRLRNGCLPNGREVPRLRALRRAARTHPRRNGLSAVAGHRAPHSRGALCRTRRRCASASRARR